MAKRFDAERALRPLKPFQRTTVDYVARRLLSDPDTVRHFLVADEVGLGKTMVARGVIARTIEALQDTVPRIDIVYVCSNGAIAKQNVARLNVMGSERARVLPTRLTMLALELARAGGIKEKGVNFFSLTPGTSLDLKKGGGRKEERALILRLIRPLTKKSLHETLSHMFMRPAHSPGWAYTCSWIENAKLEETIKHRYLSRLKTAPGLVKRLEDLAEKFQQCEVLDVDLRRDIDQCIMDFRTILARESAEALEPDLIVLDEFQRFTELLHGESEAAELAHKLFDAVDPDGNQAKVLLLSATPYRMLSLREDDADAGDHYREFLDVLDFLFGERGAEVRAELETEMRHFRNALQTLPGSFNRAKDIKSGIEGTLRRVIARTERVSETTDRDAMMQDIEVPVTVEPGDLIEARAVARVADAADSPDTVEYWKSAPYLLSFLRDYKLGQRLEHLKDAPPVALVQSIKDAKSAQIDKRAVEAYRAIPDNNGRMRALKQIAFQNDMAKRLWMPPSLPYFGERVTTSKLLIFSQWAMVPDAIAALLSYDSERAMGMDQLGHQYSDAFRKQTQPLNFRKTSGRLTGLRALTLVIPSPTLAKAVDPLAIFRSDEPVPDAPAMRAVAMKQLMPLAKMIGEKIRPPERGEPLQKLADRLGEERSGTRVETWEWACAASIDQDYGPFGSWLAAGRILNDEIREDGLENWFEHIAALNGASNAEHLWGNPEPDRLVEHLTDLALGSPATCALRALRRIAPDLSYDDPTLLNAAARVGMAFRGLFNQPESQALLRGESDDFYWQSVLHHCIDNDLQSVLDEYVHVLFEAEGQTDANQSDAVTVVSKAIDEALSLKPARIEIKRYQARRGRIHTLTPFGMRGRFATRLIAKGQEDNAAQRTDTIRTAFNSPFRPFVLASTSIGQEGLDFHLYCHRLVHWNLPSNPVDLEQREGRIHRYKNHAIRQNLAQRYSQSKKKVGWRQDIWAQMFDAAQEHTERKGGLEPYWLLEGQTSIERYALNLAYSRETSLMGWLRRSVAIYRLAFGQPRQDDLLTFLGNLKDSTEEIDIQALQINLRP